MAQDKRRKEYLYICLAICLIAVFLFSNIAFIVRHFIGEEKRGVSTEMYADSLIEHIKGVIEPDTPVLSSGQDSLIINLND